MAKGGCLVLYWTLAILLNCIQSTYAEVSCKAGTFGIGGPGSVTCDFGKDIRKQQHNFNVVQYNVQSQNTANYLLLCNWVSSEPDCTFKDGLSFTLSQGGTSLTINITSVDATMAGTVVCQLVPDEGLQTTPCNIAVVIGGSFVSDTPGETVSHAFQSNSSDTNGVFIVIIVVIAVLLLFFGCPAIVLLVFTRFRYKIVRRNQLADGKKSRGWGDICLCRLFQAGFKRCHVCLNSVDEEAGTNEMCTNTFIEVDSKEVQYTKTSVADMTTNTENEGVHRAITLQAYSILQAVKDGLQITGNGKEQRKEPPADRPIKKTKQDGRRVCDTSTMQGEIPAPALEHRGKNTDTETCSEPQRIISENLEEALSFNDSEPTSQHGSKTEIADHDENNKSAMLDNSEIQLSKGEDEVDTDQAIALLTSDQPDSSDANDTCIADELTPIGREKNTDTHRRSRKKRLTQSFRKVFKLK